MKSIVKSLRHRSRVFSVITDELISALWFSDFKRFIVLSRSRTGSNMLISYLKSHPIVYAECEIFQ